MICLDRAGWETPKCDFEMPYFILGLFFMANSFESWKWCDWSIIKSTLTMEQLSRKNRKIIKSPKDRWLWLTKVYFTKSDFFERLFMIVMQNWKVVIYIPPTGVSIKFSHQKLFTNCILQTQDILLVQSFDSQSQNSFHYKNCISFDNYSTIRAQVLFTKIF
jgi:hypothetical protein